MTVGLEQPRVQSARPQAAQPAEPTRAQQLRKTARRSVLAVTDQGVVSGGRFVATVLIGRVCGPDMLGNYALAFTLYTLAVCVQEALVTLPFTIYGARLRGPAQRAFTAGVFVHYLVLAFSFAAALGGAAIGLSYLAAPTGLAVVLAAMGVALPFAFLVEFARRVTIARLEIGTALVVDTVMAALQVGGLALLAWLGLLSAVTAYVVMGVAAAVAGLGWFTLGRRQFAFARAEVRANAARNWRFGRWVLGSQLATVARFAATPWLVALMLGTAATGVYSACETLLNAVNPLTMAATSVVLPSLSRAFAESGVSAVRRIVWQATAVLAVASLAMVACFVIGGDWLLSTLFGSQFAGQGLIISLLALGVLGETVALAASNGLWALDQANVNFWANLLALCVALATFFLLLDSWGVAGAALSVTAGRWVAGLVQIGAFIHATNRLERTEVAA